MDCKHLKDIQNNLSYRFAAINQMAKFHILFFLLWHREWILILVL